MIVVVVIALLAASVPLIALLRSLEGDRATAVRVLYSVLVVVAFAVVPVAWALDMLPAASLLVFVTAPLAMRLGDIVSHRSGAALGGALREGIVLAIAVGAILIAAQALA